MCCFVAIGVFFGVEELLELRWDPIGARGLHCARFGFSAFGEEWAGNCEWKLV